MEESYCDSDFEDFPPPLNPGPVNPMPDWMKESLNAWAEDATEEWILLQERSSTIEQNTNPFFQLKL